MTNLSRLQLRYRMSLRAYILSPWYSEAISTMSVRVQQYIRWCILFAQCTEYYACARVTIHVCCLAVRWAQYVYSHAHAPIVTLPHAHDTNCYFGYECKLHRNVETESKSTIYILCVIL